MLISTSKYRESIEIETFRITLETDAVFLTAQWSYCEHHRKTLIILLIRHTVPFRWDIYGRHYSVIVLLNYPKFEWSSRVKTEGENLHGIAMNSPRLKWAVVCRLGEEIEGDMRNVIGCFCLLKISGNIVFSGERKSWAQYLYLAGNAVLTKKSFVLAPRGLVFRITLDAPFY